MAVRVVVAEDDVIIRAGLQTLLEAAPELDVLAVCKNVDEALAAVSQHRPDVVLTDIRMPPGMGDEGIRLADSLRRSEPAIGVVVLSQHDDPDFVVALLADGSRGRGYLLKQSTAHPRQLVSALVEVAAGGSVIDPKVVEVLVRTQLRRETSPLEQLTDRERDVLAEMATGKDNAAIATTLVLTVRSVEKYINQIFSKLGLTEEPDVHRRVKAVLLYLAAD